MKVIVACIWNDVFAKSKQVIIPSTPSEKLTVEGNISASGYISTPNSITASNNITASGTGSFSDGRFTGKVGIGTTAPTALLEVRGTGVYSHLKELSQLDFIEHQNVGRIKNSCEDSRFL